MGKQSRKSPCWCGSGMIYKKCCYPEKDPNPENLYIERNAPQNSQGTQPIKVLENYLINFFENTNKIFLSKLKNDIKNSDFKPGIKYTNEEIKIDVNNIAYINSNKQIHIQETFLSYLWIICYCLITIFDEYVMLPRSNKHIMSDQLKLAKKFEFLKYGISLSERFSTWDIEKYPNPQKYLKEDKLYIEKTNSVFLHATNFVLCHEYSHFSLGHTDRTIDLMSSGKEISDEENKIAESDADFNAIEIMLVNPKTKKIKKNIQYGIVAGLCSLIFLSSLNTSKSYPTPEIRLKTILEKMNLKDEDLHWGLASLALRFWSDNKKIRLTLPPIMNTFKDCFYLIVRQIETAKNNAL